LNGSNLFAITAAAAGAADTNGNAKCSRTGARDCACDVKGTITSAAADGLRKERPASLPRVVIVPVTLASTMDPLPAPPPDPPMPTDTPTAPAPPAPMEPETLKPPLPPPPPRLWAMKPLESAS